MRICDDRLEWDHFVAASPQGSVFCKSAFLGALETEFDLILVENDGEPELGAIVLEDRVAPFPLTMYQGVMFSRRISALPSHSRLQRQFDLVTHLLAELLPQRSMLSFCLHHAFEDLRPFQWTNFGEPHLGRFQFDLRYTGVLRLDGIGSADQLLPRMRENRRREYRRGLHSGLQVEDSSDVEELIRLYRLTFARQGIAVDVATERLCRSLCRAALEKGFGDLRICRNREGQALSASLFIADERNGYYLIGANDPSHRSSGSATFLMMRNIDACAKAGLEVVDFVGVNSPNRGDYKLSFGAELAPYFVAAWRRPIDIQAPGRD